VKNMRRMEINLNRFKVIHDDKVLNAIALMGVEISDIENWEYRDTIERPKIIDVLAVDEDGKLVSIMDKAWTFQFLPII